MKIIRDREKDSPRWWLFVIPGAMECRHGFFVVWFGKVWLFRWRDDWPEGAA